MKNIFIKSLLFLSLTKCNSSISYYEGHICNLKREPMSGLEVYQREDSLNISGLTDTTGFFKIKKKENSIATYLMVKKGNEILDSIRIVGTQGGERIIYSFVEGKNDTLFIDVK
ncbi:MAG TPA: hypothetical protein VFD91_13145 [Mariniphaga sp.]|nr:hypothetical protein [Mariniphaga sp.]